MLRENWKWLVLILAISYLQALRAADGGYGWDQFVFKPDAPFWIFLWNLFLIWCIRVAYTVVEKRKSGYPNRFVKYLGVFLLGWLMVFTARWLIGLALAVVFNTFDRNFTTYAFLFNNLDLFFDYALMGNAYVLYLYLQEHHRLQQQLATAEKLVIQNQFQRLKQQMDPHFLFNNLNVLSQYIEENPAEANRFLVSFAELYRYVLEHNQTDLATVEEELAFAQTYLYLMNQRFDNGYRLLLHKHAPVAKGYVPCFALQTVLENAVKHNTGTAAQPLHIRIDLFQDRIVVENNLQPNPRKTPSTHVGLDNLARQYNVLSENALQVEKTADHFRVVLPVLKPVSHA